MRAVLPRLRRGERRKQRASASLRPAGDVFSAVANDGCMLLDMRRGRYYGLDELGSRIWQAVERGSTAAQVAAELALEYDAPPDVLVADAAKLLDDLEHRGLLTRCAERAPNPPRIVACFALLAFIDVYVNLLGMRRMIALARFIKLWTQAHIPTRHDAVLATETARRLILAAAFYPRRALCFEQTLALHLLLCRRGLRANLALGATARPFTSHGWITLDGVPLNEPADLPSQYAAFAIPGV
jgi:hypothetical protein